MTTRTDTAASAMTWITAEREFTLISGTVGPGVIVPLHSHPDRDLFSITEGAIEVFVADQWHTLGTGDVLDRRHETIAPLSACTDAHWAKAAGSIVTVKAPSRYFTV
jgi:predicted metal-dependent enzyme (double-stranded beta helix superfamily)